MPSRLKSALMRFMAKQNVKSYGSFIGQLEEILDANNISYS